MKKNLLYVLMTLFFLSCIQQKGFNYAAHNKMNNRISLMYHAKHGGKDMLESKCRLYKNGASFYRFRNLLKRKNHGPVKPQPCFVQ
ncbi:MAG: hypothetical protein RLY35_754 [Bacteroidota bacterium]|jgi:hypothetical protein